MTGETEKEAHVEQVDVEEVREEAHVEQEGSSSEDGDDEGAQQRRGETSSRSNRSTTS
jgi:hypothetical protein